MKRKLIGPLQRSLKIDYATETHSATQDGQYELHMARAAVKRKKIRGFIIPTHTLVGKTITQIDADGTSFTTSDGRHYEMHHDQSCCEVVRHSHTVGDVKHLLNTPLTFTNDDHAEPEPHPNMAELKDRGSHMWTVFEFHTALGKVQVWWLGESNGYYSEDVNLIEN